MFRFRSVRLESCPKSGGRLVSTCRGAGIGVVGVVGDGGRRGAAQQAEPSQLQRGSMLELQGGEAIWSAGIQGSGKSGAR